MVMICSFIYSICKYLLSTPVCWALFWALELPLDAKLPRSLFPQRHTSDMQ